MAHRAARADLLQRSLIVEYIQKEPAILTRTVDEMLFKGYHDEMMEKFSSFLGRKLLPNNTFGFYYGVSSFKLVRGRWLRPELMSFNSFRKTIRIRECMKFTRAWKMAINSA